MFPSPFSYINDQKSLFSSLTTFDSIPLSLLLLCWLKTLSHMETLTISRLPGLLLLLLPILCTKFSIEQPKWLFQMVSSLHQVCQRFPFKIRTSLKWFTTACLHHHMRYDLSFLNDLVSHHSCSFMTPILLGILVWMYHDYHHHFPSMQHIASKSPHGWLLFMTNSLKSLCLPYPVSFTSQYFS